MQKFNSTRRAGAAASLLAAMLVSPLAAHAAYPDKTIRIINPYPPGGATDIITRLVAQKLSEAWGQPVIVDNKPGADTQIGAEALAKSSPDGYTLGVFAPAIVVNKFLYPKANYDMSKDLQPVAGFISTPAALVVSPKFEARTLKEFVALSKSKPDSLTFSTASSNGYYVIESFNRAAGLHNRQIPYKGSVPSVLAVVSGEVSFTMDTIPNVLQLVEGGKLRMLAVTTKQRMPDRPDLPTLGEVAPGFEFSGWIIMLAPSGVPSDVINKLNQQILKVLAMTDVKSKIEALGGTTMLLSPDGLGAMLKSDIARMGEVVKSSDFSQKN